MASPRRGNWMQLKRFGRFLKGKPRVHQVFQWQELLKTMKTYSDADWAGCKLTRKSTTGGCMTLGRHSIKSWSDIQTLIALRSGERELYVTFKAASEAFGMFSIMKDLAWSTSGEIWGDASAALGIINRKGLGKTRHIDTGLLWVQQTVAQRQLSFNKVLGKNNLADLFTKYPDEATIVRHTEALAYKFTIGRASEAPKLHLLQSLVYDPYEDVMALGEAMNCNERLSRYSRRRLLTGGSCINLAVEKTCGDRIVIDELTGSGQQHSSIP